MMHRNSRKRLGMMLLFIGRPIVAFLSLTEPKAYSRAVGHLQATSEALPFVIEDVSFSGNDRIFSEISDVCIEAFFNDGGSRKHVAPWKGLQLGYLRQLQQSDLRARRKKYPDTNFMFVARRVYSTTEIPHAARTSPLILDLSEVYKLQPQAGEEYVRGEVIGFVEVTKKPYGIGYDPTPVDNDEVTPVPKDMDFSRARPVLTNLSVRYEARKSGVGSKLVNACEQRVQRQWNLNEIVLEVEDDNQNARDFYEKRGYAVLFEDPTSRRYDTSGLWLRQLRCKRQIMRKSLGSVPLFGAVDDSVGDEFFGAKLLQKLKDNVMGAAKELTRA